MDNGLTGKVALVTGGSYHSITRHRPARVA